MEEKASSSENGAKIEIDAKPPQESATSPSSDENKFDLDLLIDQIGPFGKFQLINYIIICIPICMAAMYTLSFAFTAGDLNFRCVIPECDAADPSYSEPFVNFTIPREKDGFSFCKKFISIANASDGNQCQPEFFDTSNAECCDEHVYEEGENAIINEWDLGCKNEWKLTLVGTINLVSHTVCQPILGYVSDRFGRRTTFILGLVLAATFGLIQSFSSSYVMFVILEFLAAGSGSSAYNCGFILGMELVGPEKYGVGNFILNVFFAFGEALLGVIAMLTKDWRWLLRIAYVPALIVIAYPWLIPESVRWLANKNRLKEVAEIIESAARMNKSKLTPAAVEMLNRAKSDGGTLEVKVEDEQEKELEETGLISVMKSPIILIRLIKCLFCWFTAFYVFFCITLNSVSAVGNKYVNFILICLIEIPAAGFSGKLMEKFGRRLILSINFIISGVCAVVIIFTANAPTFVQIILLILSKLCVTMALLTGYVYTAELFPTKVRLTLLSLCSTLGSIGGALVPATLHLEQYVDNLSLIASAVLTILAGVTIFFGPETMNHTLPDTLQEAEQIGKKPKPENT
ncbi:organic cation transporter protein-like [Lutzomyia longipalpis]|uniref:Putative organic cation transporter protein-like isoform x1 zootermopsis nevadensis n=1 Tax=Lutzomyia longipalpis TaxID=7200 RepID=A0A1B0CNS3_LUTLO|nr:organic cation transporter protein-like [Lutzomyia longipalpis]